MILITVTTQIEFRDSFAAWFPFQRSQNNRITVYRQNVGQNYWHHICIYIDVINFHKKKILIRTINYISNNVQLYYYRRREEKEFGIRKINVLLFTSHKNTFLFDRNLEKVKSIPLKEFNICSCLSVGMVSIKSISETIELTQIQTNWIAGYCADWKYFLIQDANQELTFFILFWTSIAVVF